MGKITSKKRGNASMVRIRKDFPDAPAFMISSKKRSDSVRKITTASTMATIAVARRRCRKR